jgi:hypothetical protein
MERACSLDLLEHEVLATFSIQPTELSGED